MQPRHSYYPLALVIAGSFVACIAIADEAAERPLSAVAARKLVGKQVYVELKVQAAKDRLEKRGEIFLDSEEDFLDEKNLGIVIVRDGAADLRSAGIADPAEHFRGKTIRVRGEVIIKEDRPRIEITAAKQIELVKGS